MAENRLGNFLFVTFHRTDDPAAPPAIVRQETMVLARPGVKGAGVLNLAPKGAPFEMRSGVDVLDLSQATLLQGAYSDSIGTPAMQLIWNGADISFRHLTDYIVLDVFVTRIKRLSAKAGGLTAGGTYWVEALWTLLPVPG